MSKAGVEWTSNPSYPGAKAAKELEEEVQLARGQVVQSAIPPCLNPRDYGTRLDYLINCLEGTTFGPLILDAAVPAWKRSWVRLWAPISRATVKLEVAAFVYLVFMGIMHSATGGGAGTVVFYYSIAFPAWCGACVRLFHTHFMFVFVGVSAHVAWSRCLVFQDHDGEGGVMVTRRPADMQKLQTHAHLGRLVRGKPAVKYLAYSVGWYQTVLFGEMTDPAWLGGLTYDYTRFVFFLWACLPAPAITGAVPFIAIAMCCGSAFWLPAWKRWGQWERQPRGLDRLLCRYLSFVEAIAQKRIDAAIASAAAGSNGPERPPDGEVV